MIFISNIFFNLQLFDIYDAKIQYLFRIFLLSHENYAFRGIFLTLSTKKCPACKWYRKNIPYNNYKCTSFT